VASPTNLAGAALEEREIFLLWCVWPHREDKNITDIFHSFESMTTTTVCWYHEDKNADIFYSYEYFGTRATPESTPMIFDFSSMCFSVIGLTGRDKNT
jgi:hypothetical protein